MSDLSCVQKRKKKKKKTTEGKKGDSFRDGCSRHCQKLPFLFSIP